ncbi:RTA1-domain-containing protein [Aureobasidium pullulans]|uniref:RTA1-domain-containing protein n=1 Tax=Aureobasidium pullulans TaxID=5580 RepID=A0A4S9LJV4_AURPU|nr:RTA1-domain-containing protein [Aureobasidium pullulans]THY29847.1 RTA1-domain-containing protein [Aureobasidium pullulans]
MARGYCTEVTAQCPVEATTYGYRPNQGANIFFCVVFGILFIAQLFLGIKARLKGFTFAVVIGCFGECVGYIGRLIMHNNPWSQTGFKIQIVCLILSPSFLAAGIYLTIKHLVIHFGPQYSRLRPNLYTWIFITADAASILVQAAGGGIAAGEQLELVKIGNSIMVAGICVQVATMALCGVVAADFFLRRYRSRQAQTNLDDPMTRSTAGFKYYVGASALAFVTVFIRSVYRIPEMVGGWGNPLMQNEKEFLVLDGMMVCIAAIALTVAHPGIFFPEFKEHKTPKKEKKSKKSKKSEEAGLELSSSDSA